MNLYLCRYTEQYGGALVMVYAPTARDALRMAQAETTQRGEKYAWTVRKVAQSSRRARVLACEFHG